MKSKKKKIDHNKIIRLFIVLITIFIIALFFPKSESIEREVKVGDIWTSKDLIAQFSFPVLKYPEEYEKDLIAAEKSVYPIFEYNDTIQSFCSSSLKKFTENLKSNFKIIQSSPSLRDSIIKIYSINLDSIQLQKILKQITPDYFNQFKSIANNLIDYIYSTGYLDKSKDGIQKDSIFIRRKNEEKKFHKNNFLDREDIEKIILQSIEKFETFKELSNPLLKKFTNEFIQPNLIYNERETQLAIEEARYKVSKNIGIVLENERIVAKHQKITEDIKRKIDSYRKIKFEKGERFNSILQFIGKFLHIGVILLLPGIYIYLFRKKIYTNTSKIIIISIILIIISFIAFIVSKIETELPVEYLIFIPAASMLITIIFDSRLGFYLTVVISLIIGGIRGNDYTITTANIIAGALAVYSVRDIKNRAQIYRSLIFILGGYIAIIIAFGLERYSSLTDMGNEALFAFVNSIIS
ncbi:MAG: hydrolase, partial [Ignavibacteria bacterium]